MYKNKFFTIKIVSCLCLAIFSWNKTICKKQVKNTIISSMQWHHWRQSAKSKHESSNFLLRLHFETISDFLLRRASWFLFVVNAKLFSKTKVTFLQLWCKSFKMFLWLSRWYEDLSLPLSVTNILLSVVLCVYF